MRVHILGASGSGTTTLGAALAARTGAVHLDTDDFFWLPTDPPFEEPRPMPERLAQLAADLDAAGRFVLSGSLCGWEDPLVPRFELVVFLRVPTGVRLARLHERERDEFGAAALAPGGRMHANHTAFLEWAAGYESGDLSMRSLARHEAWLAALACPVLRFEGAMEVERQVEQVLAADPAE
jgi:adenylate kinase family enzyme